VLPRSIPTVTPIC